MTRTYVKTHHVIWASYEVSQGIVPIDNNFTQSVGHLTLKFTAYVVINRRQIDSRDSTHAHFIGV